MKIPQLSPSRLWKAPPQEHPCRRKFSYKLVDIKYILYRSLDSIEWKGWAAFMWCSILLFDQLLHLEHYIGKVFKSRIFNEWALLLLPFGTLKWQPGGPDSIYTCVWYMQREGWVNLYVIFTHKRDCPVQQPHQMVLLVWPKAKFGKGLPICLHYELNTWKFG